VAKLDNKAFALGTSSAALDLSKRTFVCEGCGLTCKGPNVWLETIKRREMYKVNTVYGSEGRTLETPARLTVAVCRTCALEIGLAILDQVDKV
jgi:hypothetical protein